MSIDDQAYHTVIINLEIDGNDMFACLSIYYNWRANGYEPDEAFDHGVEPYIKDRSVRVPGQLNAQ